MIEITFIVLLTPVEGVLKLAIKYECLLPYFDRCTFYQIREVLFLVCQEFLSWKHLRFIECFLCISGVGHAVVVLFNLLRWCFIQLGILAFLGYHCRVSIRWWTGSDLCFEKFSLAATWRRHCREAGVRTGWSARRLFWSSGREMMGKVEMEISGRIRNIFLR